MFGEFLIDDEAIIDILESSSFEYENRRVVCDQPLEVKICQLKSGQYMAGNDLVRIYVTVTDKEDILPLFSRRLISDYTSSITSTKVPWGIPQKAWMMYRREFKET